MLDMPPPPTDPTLAANQKKADASLVDQLGQKSQGDMSSLMSRYGTHLAMAGVANGSPLVAPSSLPTGGLGSTFGALAGIK